MNKIFFITAGGTGGHIIPAISIYYALKNRNYNVKFLCRKKDLKIVEQLRPIVHNLLFLPGKGLKRKFSLDNIFSLIYLLYGIIISLFWILKFKPDAILSFGGYISFPILVSGALKKIPIFLFEQNSYPGIVNRIFKRWAKVIFVNFKYTQKFFKNSIIVGNPVRDSLKRKISKKECARFFNIRPKNVILVMGGSQGALKINEIFSKIVDELKNFEIIWITGKFHFYKFKSKAKRGKIYITPYLKEMEYAYNIAKLAITRAGALTITELSYFGIPAILIPLPHSAENHQLINAKIIEKSGGGIVIEESELTPRILFDKINKIFKNKSQLKKMGNSIKKFYKQDATKKIIKIIEEKLK